MSETTETKKVAEAGWSEFDGRDVVWRPLPMPAAKKAEDDDRTERARRIAEQGGRR